MRIHTDHLTRERFREAAQKAGVQLVALDKHGSKSRARAFNFYISGSGRYGGQWGKGDYQSATWDEWGIFLNVLFSYDPAAHTGRHGYLSAEHFHWSTGDRFRDLTPSEQHLRHNWLSGPAYSHADSYERHCKCGATHRWLKTPYVWTDQYGPTTPEWAEASA